jgi:hypothetical protein
MTWETVSNLGVGMAFWPSLTEQRNESKRETWQSRRSLCLAGSSRSPNLRRSRDRFHATVMTRYIAPRVSPSAVAPSPLKYIAL